MMAQEKYILVKQFSQHSYIETQFIESLFEYELVQPDVRGEDVFIDERDIDEIEKMFRLHRDLGINIEGLSAVSEILARLEKLQNEMALLKQRLRLYE